MHGAWLWAVFTLIAAGAQTLRNAMQRELTATLGAVGATQVRFVFGLLFGIAFLAGLRLWFGVELPAFDAAALSWTTLGACAQIAATALMLIAMGRENFVVVTAYIKTEAVQAAIFALIFLGERPTPGLLIAIALATSGVLMLSWPKAGKSGAAGWGPAWQGLLAAAFFALAAVSFRAAVIGLATPSFALAAATILAAGLAIQTAILLVYFLAADRAGMIAILHSWRASLFAGFMGAVASQFWFLAFALTSVARVRTLALIEVLFAQVISQRLFREAMSKREWAGLALVLAGLVTVING